MAESLVLSVIRIWAAMAWADGVLAEAEAEGLHRLIRDAELTPAERVAAGTMLETPVSLDDLNLTTLPIEARKGIYRAACKLAVVDRHLAPAEQAMLVRVRDVLGVPAEAAAEIQADIPSFPVSRR
jgi:uncharacterized tellurite resistance protein B-like protein